MKLPELRYVRELRGLTQPELAAASGVSMRTIVNEEHGGEARPSTAHKLAVALDVSLTVLAGVEPFPVAQQKPPRALEPPPLILPVMQQEQDANLRREATLRVQCAAQEYREQDHGKRQSSHRFFAARLSFSSMLC